MYGGLDGIFSIYNGKRDRDYFPLVSDADIQILDDF